MHVVGAGLAGLACAVDAARNGHRVVVHEAAPHAGGRCRSFFDRTLGRVIDNGTHLLLSANTELLDYAAVIGGSDRLETLAAAYPFLDLDTGERWTLRPNAGRLPWWIFSKSRRVPGTALSEYLALLRLSGAAATDTVAGRLDRGQPLYRRLLEPLSTAILNTEAEDASARLLGAVMRETMGRGGDAMRPVLAPGGLGAALVEPAVVRLLALGGEVRFGDPLHGLEDAPSGRRLAALTFRSGRVALEAGDACVLAVPAAAAAQLVPGRVPDLVLRPIVNVHYRVEGAAGPPLLGVIGGVAQWIFVRGDVVSVTISAAGQWAEAPASDLAARVWWDVARALELTETETPPFRVIKERRATLAHSPKQEMLRPSPETGLDNLYLAGDWTATGLPCTLEGAVRSGRTAARLIGARAKA